MVTSVRSGVATGGPVGRLVSTNVSVRSTTPVIITGCSRSGFSLRTAAVSSPVPVHAVASKPVKRSAPAHRGIGTVWRGGAAASLRRTLSRREADG